MAKVKNEDYRELSLEDLNSRIQEEELQYKKKKFAHAVSPLENPLELRWMRRNIARIKTELRKRELEDKK